LCARKKLNNDPLIALHVDHTNILSRNNPMPNPNTNHAKTITQNLTTTLFLPHPKMIQEGSKSH